MQDNNKTEYGVMIAKKSERLTTALYLVTDLIDGSEPIKNSLRKNSVSLLSSMNALMQYDVKDRNAEFACALKSTTEIISLLHVASSTGLISDMNGSLLINGFRVLQAVLEKKQPVLTKEMISVDAEDLLYEKTESFSGMLSTSYDALTFREVAKTNEDTMPKKTTSINIDALRADNQTQQEEKNVFYKGQDIKDKEPALRSVLMQHAGRNAATLASSFQNRKQTRRDQILSLFVKGVDVSIKDISSKIKGCSEKTIQRELNALVYDNVIERIGEKRWSRYILK